MRERVRIVEVGPRDGLQNEKSSVATNTKLELFRRLVGSPGNVATEDIVYLLHGLGADTGGDLDGLVDCAAWISAVLERPLATRVGRAMTAERRPVKAG